MSIIQVSSELMKNQKAASVLPPQSLFESLQDASGNAMFFSISDDKVFNLIIEKPGIDTGWEAVDLSSELAAFHDDKNIQAQTFAVTQTSGNGNITMALVVRADGEKSDTLYVLSDLPNTIEADWTKASANRSWTARPYDNSSQPLDAVTIAYVYLTPTQKETLDTQLVAEVRSATTNYLQNYVVNLKGANAWAVLQTAENFDTVLGQVIGKAKASSFAGLYQLTSVNNSLTVDFTPLQSMFGPPTVIKMTAPKGATKMAALPVDEQNNTNVFITASDGLYLFTPDKQLNFGKATKIIDHAIFAGTQKLYAHQSNGYTVVWGLNQQGEVFYSQCVKGQENVAKAWSYPVPILTGVAQIASFLGQKNDSNVIFAHTQGQHIVQLTQDVKTTNWHQREILLPGTKANDVVEYNTYTTHIQLTGDDKLPLSEATLAITSTSLCSVYIDNVYHILSPNIPIEVKPDPSGTITVVQETQNLGAVCYHLALQNDSAKVDVNPMSKLLTTVSGIKTGNDLGKVTVTNADGSKQKLIPGDASTTDLDNTAAALQQFTKIAAKMPQNGQANTTKKTRTLSAVSSQVFVANSSTIWGLSFGVDGVKYHEGDNAMQQYGLQVNTNNKRMMMTTSSVALGNIWDAIEVAAGDAFKWLQHAIDDVSNFFVKVFEDVYHFFVKIGEEVYRFVLDAVVDVVQAIEFVLNKIKVFFEDLIKWVGFLFQWQDIIRTHNVLKNIFKKYLYYSVEQISTYKTGITKAFEDVKTRLDQWAGLENLSGSLSEKSKNSNEMKGQNDPQANWGNYHLKNNVTTATTASNINTGTNTQLSSLLETLKKAIAQEGTLFEEAFKQLQTQIIEQVPNLSAGEIIKRLIAIIGDLLVSSVENLLVSAIDIIEVLVEGVLQLLDATIDIPVISWLYKEITGNELSLLDVICLVVAIPGTLVYKIAYNQAPYPDNAHTNHLIKANSWSEIQKAFVNSVAQVQHQSTKRAVENSSAVAENETPTASIHITLEILRITAGFSSLVFIPLSIIKAENGKSAPASILHGLCFFATTGPNIAASLVASTDERWDKTLNEMIYGYTVIQKLVDIFTYKKDTDPDMAVWAECTKFIDLTLGVADLVPTIASVFYKQDAKTITSMIGGVCWNLNRMTTPFANINKTPQVFAAKMVLIGLYGIDQFVLMTE